MRFFLIILCACTGFTEKTFAQTWIFNADGVWQVATNWSPSGFPNAVDASVLFGSAITANRAIRLGDNAAMGSLTFDNANNYKISSDKKLGFQVTTGSASITNIGGGSPLITSDIVIGSDLSITAGSGTVTISGNFSQVFGEQSISKYGSGVLQLDGRNRFGDGLFINQGTVRVYMEQSLGNGTNVVTLNGGTLEIGANITTQPDRLGVNTSIYTVGATGGSINVSNNHTFTISSGTVLAGTGTLTNSGLGTLVLKGDNSSTFSGAMVVQSGTVRISAENNLGAATSGLALNGGKLNVTSDLTASSTKVFTIGANGGTLDVDYNKTLTLGFNGNLIGSGNMTNAGTGTLVLGGNNSSFTGNTIINAGTVRITAENNLGAAGNDVTINGGTLNIGGSFTANSGKLFTIDASGGALSIDSATTLTLGTANQIAGSGALTVSGSGTLSITAAQNFAGNVTINGATLTLSGANGTAINVGTFTIGGGGVLYLDDTTHNADRIAGAVELNGGTLRYKSGTTATEAVGAVTLTSGGSSIEIDHTGLKPVLNLAGLTQTATDATVHFGALNGTLNGAGNNPKISITGAANGLLGGWATVRTTSAGTLEFAEINSSSLRAMTGTTTGAQTAWTTTAIKAKPNANVTFTTANRVVNNLTLANTRSVDLNGRVLTNFSGGFIGQGNTTISNGTITVGTTATGGNLFVHVDTGGFMTNNAVLANNGAGVVGLVKAANGTLLLGGNNTYTGGTYVNAGTLKLTAANRISDSSALTVQTGGTFDLNSFAETVGSIAGGGSIALGSATLTSGGDNSSTTFSGIASGTGGLAKTGNGILTLSGANTYTGGTTVSAGTVQVSRDANLGGATSAIILNGGTLNATETFTADNSRVLQMTGNGTVSVDAGKTLTFNQASQFTGSGNLTNAGAGTLILGGASSYTGNLIINAGELKVQGTAANINGLLTPSVITNLSGSGGTLTFSLNESVTNFVNYHPKNPSNIKLGFDVGSGADANTLQVVGPVGDNNLNWAGLVIKGGTVNLGADHTLVGNGATTLEVSGGRFILGGGYPPGPKTLTLSGDVTLTGGVIDGGPGGGSLGTLVTSGNITSSGTILENGPNIVMQGSGLTKIQGTTPLNGVGAFTKTGTGTVQVDQQMTASSIAINQGTLLLGASDRLNDNVNITMQGGSVFATGGYQETVGTLTLLGAAFLDLGDGATSYLAFADSSGGGWAGLLTVTNYLDSANQIYFGTTSGGLTTEQLAQVVWDNPYGANTGIRFGATIDNDGRIRPAPVPEPATVIALVLLGGLISWHERNRLAVLFSYFRRKIFFRA